MDQHHSICIMVPVGPRSIVPREAWPSKYNRTQAREEGPYSNPRCYNNYKVDSAWRFVLLKLKGGQWT